MHACPDSRACRRDSRIPTILPMSSNEVIGLARQEENRTEDNDIPLCEPERNRSHIQVFVDNWGNEQKIGWYRIGGHWYWSHDLTSGLRKYGEGAVTFGGYLTVAEDYLTGLIPAWDVYPADIQEWDHVPNVIERLTDAIGERPYIASTDRGFTSQDGLRVVREPAASRRSGTFQEVRGKSKREDWRTAAFDEDGVPHAVAAVAAPKPTFARVGIDADAGTRHQVSMRDCPFPGNSICQESQTIPCSTEPRLLRASLPSNRGLQRRARSALSQRARLPPCTSAVRHRREAISLDSSPGPGSLPNGSVFSRRSSSTFFAAHFASGTWIRKASKFG